MKKIVAKSEQALVAQEHRQLIAEAMQLIPHKPYLVEIIQQKKIRECGDLEKEKRCGEVINYVLALLGVSSTSGDGKELHYLAVEDYILTSLSKYTFAEIKEAFKMLVKGEFKEDIKEVYNKLDCIILGKVMNCYDKEKARITSGYYEKLNTTILKLQEKKNELTQEEKDKIVYDGILKCFDYYVEHKELEPCRSYIFDVLWSKGKLLHFSKEYRKEKLEKAKKDIIEQIKKNRMDSNYKNYMQQIQNGNVPGDIALAKEYVLADYFQQIIDEKLHIRDKLS